MPPASATEEIREAEHFCLVKGLKGDKSTVHKPLKKTQTGNLRRDMMLRMKSRHPHVLHVIKKYSKRSKRATGRGGNSYYTFLNMKSQAWKLSGGGTMQQLQSLKKGAWKEEWHHIQRRAAIILESFIRFACCLEHCQKHSLVCVSNVRLCFVPPISWSSWKHPYDSESSEKCRYRSEKRRMKSQPYTITIWYLRNEFGL